MRFLDAFGQHPVTPVDDEGGHTGNAGSLRHLVGAPGFADHAKGIESIMELLGVNAL